jgi:predicted adenylyl cyclase CyaB
MRNIEIKVSINGFDEVIPLIKEKGAKFEGQLQQVDTYYESKSGRLKIREINGRKFEIIYYERPNDRNSRISDYYITEIAPDQLQPIKHVLEKTRGEKIVVKKARSLWLYKNTRIHLDEVEDLGTFLELETVTREGNLDEARKEYDEISEFLKLSRLKSFGESYSDMLMQKKSVSGLDVQSKS